MNSFLGKMWQRVERWFTANATHVTSRFFEEGISTPLDPFGGYLRLWLADGFLAEARTWGNDHFPALHGGVSLKFLGGASTPFTTITRTTGTPATAEVRLDFPITPLLPFSGGIVEIEAALYQASVKGPLGTAVGLVGSLASLIGPPLSAAVAIADKVSDGLDAVLAATGDQPLLAVHWTMISAGGGGNPVRPGYLVVIRSEPEKLPGTLSIADGRLQIDTGTGPHLVTGFDYLVLRVECRSERDDWRFPDLDDLIRDAGTAFIEGHEDVFKARRTEAIARAWNSTDLTPVDRKRVAKLVADEIDAAKELGAVPRGNRSLDAVAVERLLAPDAPELGTLSLDDLLAG